MAKKIYQFKVTLHGIRPPIWRRFQVYDNLTFYEFHHVIQTVMMGWHGGHLHSFDVGGLQITDAETLSMGWGDGEDENNARLNQYVLHEKQKLRYEYDFGDGWEHQLLLEKILPVEADTHYPRCLKGKRNCPPEDCGGVWGYATMLEALADKNHSEHKMYAEWVGDDFDAEEFDLEWINELLEEM